MKRIKVKVKMVGTGTEKDMFRVNLPTWKMIDVPDYNKQECYVEVPENETTNNKLDQEKIRKKYKENWSNFDKSKVEV